MRGVKECEESTGRMKKHRYSSKFKVTAVKLANHPGIETQGEAPSSAYGRHKDGPEPASDTTGFTLRRFAPYLLRQRPPHLPVS